MTLMSLSKYRIVYVTPGYGYGNWEIQQPQRFLFFKYWKGTHLCPSRKAAEDIIKHLAVKEAYYGQPKNRNVVDVFDADGEPLGL